MTDGASKTLMVGEKWLDEGLNAALEELKENQGFSTEKEGYGWIGQTTDAAVAAGFNYPWYLPASSWRTAGVFTEDGIDGIWLAHRPKPDHRVDWDNWDSDDWGRGFGSSHPSSMNGVFCDGSVRTIRYDIDAAIYARMGLRDDGEIGLGDVAMDSLQ